jgi:recombination protein RecA
LILAPKHSWGSGELQPGKPCHRTQNHLHFCNTKDHGKVPAKRDFNEPDRRPLTSRAARVDSGAALPTGFSELDQALGLGGYPRGQICEIYGPPACGKTSLLLRAIATAQCSGGTCAFIDGDHTLDTHQALRNGVDAQNLYLSEPVSVEQALETTLTLAQSGAMDLIAIDTLSALPMQARLQTELDSGSRKAEFQKFERYVSQAIWRLSKSCQSTGTTILICSQLRRKPGSLYHQGASTTATLALKMHAAVRLAMEPWAHDLPASGADGPGTYGDGPPGTLRARIHIIKNKYAPIKGHINLIIMYNHE